jgi:hypothetical protein
VATCTGNLPDRSVAVASNILADVEPEFLIPFRRVLFGDDSVDVPFAHASLRSDLARDLGQSLIVVLKRRSHRLAAKQVRLRQNRLAGRDEV